LRASRDLSDADIVALLVFRGHLLGRTRLYAAFDPEGAPAKLKVLNEKDVDPDASYLIYSETIQQFVGIARDGAYFMGEPGGGGRARLVFFPAAKA